MSQKNNAKSTNKYVKNDKNNKNKKGARRDKDGNLIYRNPANNSIGKIIIAILAILMALSPLITLIAMAIAGKL